MAESTATLGGLVASRPRLAPVFERLGLDYCCGGQQTLAEACSERELDPSTVIAMLEVFEAEDAAQPDDVTGLSVAELSEHIVVHHHQPLRPQMDRISELLAKVVRAHGDQDPTTHRLQARFDALRAELEEHMLLEEEELFPACRALERGDRASPLGGDLLTQLEDTHSSTGAALAELREIGGDYRPENAHCTTHRVLLSELSAFELELHQHIHEENNILFPQVRGLLG